MPAQPSPTEDRQLVERVVLEATVPEPRSPADATDDPTLFLERAGADVGRSGGMFDAIGPSGAVFSFAPREASDALNTAIRIQEASRHHGGSGGTRCAIGVALGIARPTEARAGGLIGRGAATARRLADAANPGAVLVDIDTVAAANLLDLTSEVGRRDGRTHHDYLGPVGHLPGQGSGTATITFVELVWDESPHGVRADALTDLAWWQSPPTRATNGDGRPVDRWRAGTVRSWNGSRQHGFIVSEEEFFYFDDRFIVSSDPPPVGSQVWFHARPPLIAGKSRLAVTVIEQDHRLPFETTHLDGPEGPATQVSDRAGNRALLPVGPRHSADGHLRVVAGYDAQPRLA